MKHLEKQYFPNLDATRFFAFLPVYFTHAFFTDNPEIKQSTTYTFIENHMRVGILGLDYFFVLSSFLITWIILEEYKNTGAFDFRNYFVRRSLRIWPLYFALIFICYLVAHFIFPTQLPPIEVYLLFISNFYVIYKGDAFLFMLVILWSVSVEEQFYLCWALVLKYFKRYLVPISFLLILASLLFRWSALSDQKALYFHTFSTLANFAIGALLAYVGFTKNAVFKFLKTVNKPQIASIYFLFFLNVLFYKNIYAAPYMQVFERCVFSLFFAFIIFDQCFSEESLFKLGKWKWTNYLGNASFGLYCFHGIVITFYMKLAQYFSWNFSLLQVSIINPILLLLVTIAITYFSFEFFEKRFLKLKKNFYSFKAS